MGAITLGVKKIKPGEGLPISKTHFYWQPILPEYNKYLKTQKEKQFKARKKRIEKNTINYSLQLLHEAKEKSKSGLRLDIKALQKTILQKTLSYAIKQLNLPREKKAKIIQIFRTKIRIDEITAIAEQKKPIKRTEAAALISQGIEAYKQLSEESKKFFPKKILEELMLTKKVILIEPDPNLEIPGMAIILRAINARRLIQIAGAENTILLHETIKALDKNAQKL